MNKIHAFLVALEYLNICDFSIAAGPLRYISLSWKSGATRIMVWLSS